MSVLRWFLLVPGAAVAWCVAFVAGIALHGGLFSLCAADERISGMCASPWYKVASLTVICFGAGLAAVLILLVCTWLAPAHKRQVAIATFVAGGMVAVIMGLSTGLIAAPGAALGAGGLGLWLLLRCLPRPEGMS